MGNKKVNRIMSNNKSSARPNYNNYHVLTITGYVILKSRSVHG